MDVLLTEDARLELAESIRAELDGLVEGAAEDLQKFGVAIAQDIVMAAQEQDDQIRASLLRELKAQVRALAEVNRIRVNAAAWDTVQRVVGVAGAVAVGLLRRASGLI